MGRVFFNTRLNFQKLTASYQCLGSDSGKVFLVNPTATTDITLPTYADAGEGWNARIMITEDVAGTVGGMGQIVNVDFGSGNVVIGQIGSSSNVAGDFAVANDDFVGFTAAASPGDYIDVFTDGVNWYVSGMCTDAAGTDVLFHTAASA
tara:strand:- start:54 stop:500 length:447 start_codon:yes stop_codon:yes gene_type:complete